MKGFIKPIVVLTLICLFVSGLLAYGNYKTQPAIQKAAAARTEAARREVLPNAESFVQLEAEGLPPAISEVLGTSNNVGFIFMVNVEGYGGEIKIICAIGPDGKIIKNKTLSQSETMGIATPVFEREYLFTGKDINQADSIDGIAGATITSRAYMNGIHDAFTAFEIVKEMQF